MSASRGISVSGRLRAAGLRPTRQRIALAELLFKNGDRHITAEELHEEAIRAKVPVSLATVYNTLNQLTEAGLLREVAIEGQRTYFDTNTSNHFHYYLESERRLFDIPTSNLTVVGLPEPPEGTRVRRFDVIVRLESVPRKIA
jgi:Fur family iron response transcriptional regulator